MELAAWILGGMIGHAVGLCIGYRMGFTACTQERRQQLSQLDRRRRRRRA